MTEQIPVTIAAEQGLLDLIEATPETIDVELVPVIEMGTGGLSTVAYTGEYSDLLNPPEIPVLPLFAEVATTGDYNSLLNQPFIPLTASDVNAVPVTPGARLMLETEGTKLAGMAPQATKNSADPFLLARENHTGTQGIATVTGLQAALNLKVDRENGKGLSTNDYTTAEKSKLASLVNTDLAPLTARVSAVEAGKVDKVDGKGLSDTNYTQAEKDKLSGLYVPDLTPLNSAIASLQTGKVDKVNGKGLSDTNFTQVEKTKLAGLSNFDSSTLELAVSELQTGKVDKIAGKGLSTNDYTDAEKTKLAGLANTDLTNVNNRLTSLETGKVDKLAGKGLSTNDYTTAEKTKLEGLSNFDPSTINSNIAALDAAKVDKVAGKALSANDYTDADKTKLGGIAVGATANMTDAALLARGNHTGTQAIATVSGLQAALDSKVASVPGYGLSSNDFTSAEKTKLAGLENSHFRGTFATYNGLVTGVTNPVPGDYADVDTPGVNAVRYAWDATDSVWVAGASESTPVTAAQVKTLYESNADTNAFTDSEKAKLAGLSNFDPTAINSAISDLQTNKVQVVEGKGLSTNDYTNTDKTKLAGLANYNDSALVDAIADLEATKVEVVPGKVLSSNDYTTAEKDKLASLENYNDVPLQEAIFAYLGTFQTSIDAKQDKVAGKGLSTEDYTTEDKDKLDSIMANATVNSPDYTLLARANHTGTQAIATITGLQDLLDSVAQIDDTGPSTTSTYSSTELERIFTQLNEADANLADEFGGLIDQLSLNKVDKVTGKGLSTNDYTDTEKAKLAAIAAGATVNSTDAFLLDRGNHTGEQGIDTILGLNATLNAQDSKFEDVDQQFALVQLELNSLATGKVDATPGYGLSQNDFTDANLSKLTGIADNATANQADAYLLSRANHTGTQAQSTITDLVSTLTTMQSSINAKQPTEVGKGLSTNDYTTVEKTKLSNLALPGIDKKVTFAAATGAISLNLAAATTFELTLTGNVTLTATNTPSLVNEEFCFVVRLICGATPYTVTWPSGVTYTWLNTGGGVGQAPAANKMVEFVFTFSSPTVAIGRKGSAN